ncbi:MAG: hypothetical protein DRP00_05425, partial [Candidatus Aenigmatarchaeota archaeon]
SDIAYIYKKNFKIDNNILDVFNNMGLTYDLIDEKTLPIDFSDYKLIFVGDERFKHENQIPIEEHPTIIANYYFGKEFGLTDNDGISKLAATKPLSVKQDHQIIQVYTQAKYSGKSISLPYYYLDDENKAPGMETSARTYTGNSNGYDFGDVISYANAGTHLTNGKTTQAKICFYGIIESDYWTPAARDLFKDCIGFVAITCENDNDCPDQEVDEPYCSQGNLYQNIEEYECENPGTVHSQCVDDVIQELVENCGQSSCEDFGDNYCKNGDVYHSQTCYDKGCANAECFSNQYENEQLVQKCTQDETCIQGECIDIECYTDADCNDSDDFTTDTCVNPATPESYCEHEPIECLQDTDCDDDYSTDNYCINNDVYYDFHNFSCVQGLCEEEVSLEPVEECADLCIDGQCKEIICSSNPECGTDGFTGQRYCQNENIYEDFISYTCENPATILSFCSNSTLPILIDYCEGTCISGECITCFADLECGTDSFIGDKYCIEDDVYQDYQEFTCENPGTGQSDCSSAVTQQLIKECADTCVDGGCIDIECYTDANCDDSDLYTYDKCNNPATPQSYCSHTPINCMTDQDCGFTGFFGNEYCQNNDLFKNFQNADCINPETTDSYCSILTEPVFLIDCGEDYCDEWQEDYCFEDNVWHSRTCYNKGCENASCFTNSFIDSELSEDCIDLCLDGECVECIQDSDCPSDYYADNYCSNNNVYRDFIDYSCTNNVCSSKSIPELVEECGDDLYCNGQESCRAGACQSGTPINCNAFDLSPIATCENSPDNNPLTFDFFIGFTSTCNEDTDTCTLGTITLEHTCNVDICQAECETQSDCSQKCTISSHKLYELIGCFDCICEYSSSPQCVIGECGAECEVNEDCPTCPEDYCDDATLIHYPNNYETCGTAGSEGCLCQSCEPELIEDAPECQPDYCQIGPACLPGL